MSGALMLQGAGSNVGKSLLVAGLCRAARRRGLTVRPFKPQNMSNNAAVADLGDEAAQDAAKDAAKDAANGAQAGEIGRAQALQARAAGARPHVDMNPVLLKPETETGAQLVVRGRRRQRLGARDYARVKPGLLPEVLESFERLRAQADLVIVEGAGSPAEVNLRAGDIANMGFARAADIPVVLIGDIDRGGVIAQLVGTMAVLDPADAAHIRGFIINKFRGDPSLFDDGYRLIAERTGWRGYGVAPWFAGASALPAEDAAELPARSVAAGPGAVKIVVPALSRIANFDDLDPLRLTPGVSVEIVAAGRALPGDADLILLPGSKSTRGDLDFLRAQGWDIDILAHRRRGGRVLGLCGGYQMLGLVVRDPEGIEGPPGDTPGLGLLDVETVMRGDKSVRRAAGVHRASGLAVTGYEIHLGATTGPDAARPMLDLAPGGRPDGAQSADGLVEGTYAHGLFVSDAFRAAYLERLGAAPSGLAFDARVDRALDDLAAHLEAHLDVGGLLALAAR